MYEESKLKEAKYFYSKMVSKTDNYDHFRYNLSAFLSAARSVLQYSNEEAKTKLDGQQWYDNHIASSKTLAFFKKKRNINVHIQPVQVNHDISIQTVVGISLGLRIKILDQNGRVTEERSHESPAPNTLPKVTYRFFFSDWHGTEDVLQLCDLYLNELQYVVEDGQNNGFLTK